MDSSVRSRTDHSETLRVARTANGDEIARAFASQMRTARMRPDIGVARLAMLSVAYETLRDPAKRRAYDTSIGIRKEPIAAPLRNATPFMGLVTIDRLNRLADPVPTAPQPAARVARDARVEPRVAGFIAASLRQPTTQADPTPEPEPVPPAPVSQPAPLRVVQPAAQEVVVEPPSTRFDENSIEDGRFAIGRTGATLGACVVGVAILSVALALPTPNPDRLPEQPAQAQQALTVALPPASTADDGGGALTDQALAAANSTPQKRASSSLAMLPSNAEAGPSKPVRAQQFAETAVSEAAAATSALDGSADQSASVTPAVQSADELAPDPASVTAAAASMPLANATVARTIQRIGYACGRVTSTSPVDGAAGVFRISCSSGDSYQATPVRGRYHFRRWGRN